MIELAGTTAGALTHPGEDIDQLLKSLDVPSPILFWEYWFRVQE